MAKYILCTVFGTREVLFHDEHGSPGRAFDMLSDSLEVPSAVLLNWNGKRVYLTVCYLAAMVVLSRVKHRDYVRDDGSRYPSVLGYVYDAALERELALRGERPIHVADAVMRQVHAAYRRYANTAEGRLYLSETPVCERRD
jgi:hypothetical protein